MTIIITITGIYKNGFELKDVKFMATCGSHAGFRHKEFFGNTKIFIRICCQFTKQTSFSKVHMKMSLIRYC